jgi:S1-C subfamily serine protease
MNKVFALLVSFLLIFSSISYAQLSFTFSSKTPKYTADVLLDEQIMDSVVSLTMIGEGLGSCSGTVIYEDDLNQYILTAKHCVGLDEEMYVEDSRVTYIMTSADDDIALVVIDEKLGDKIAARLGYRDGVKKSKVYHVGFPSGVAYKASGEISKVTDDWQIYSFPAIPGCSGGGVFNEYGQLIGVLWGSRSSAEEEDPVKSLGEPLKDIKRFLKIVLPQALK